MVVQLSLIELKLCVQLINQLNIWDENCYAMLYLNSEDTLSALSETRITNENKNQSRKTFKESLHHNFYAVSYTHLTLPTKRIV